LLSPEAMWASRPWSIPTLEKLDGEGWKSGNVVGHPENGQIKR
jgi:hypothetical protein